ncbi:hypothetical protein ACFOEE_02465 [Pseudoalteromonas fenneropenaei]|uniref:DUF3592 domain-containing protein n=1 Tax=Pseudoalteromonas fenneropenaei TaxID=1737459 RepID=A0ABV7CFP9_9GAMM
MFSLNGYWLVLCSVLLVLAVLPSWVKSRKAFKKRKWRSVKLTGLTRVKAAKTGPLELLSESGLLAQFEYQGQHYSCQMAFRDTLWQRFQAKLDTHIWVDPDNLQQCHHNAQQAYRYSKLWLLSALLLMLCAALAALTA